MRALLKAGVRLHQIESAQPIQFWVTEFGWDTNPPRPHGAPLNLAARWTAESLHQMWLSGVSLVTWFLLQDYPSPSPYQSGFYFPSSSLADAQPKPSLTAFRFPFVAYLGEQKNTVSVWGRDATSDQETATIQLRHGKSGRWRSVALVSSNTSGIFQAMLKLKAKKKDWLRAVDAGLRKVPRVLAYASQGSAYRALGQLSPLGRKASEKIGAEPSDRLYRVRRCGPP